MAQIVSLGVHILDTEGRPVTRIPEGQNLDLLEEIHICVAGTAAGLSVDVAKLGGEVLAMGAIGEDEPGDFIVNTMQKYGVDTSGLVRKQGVQTSMTMLPIRPNGERPALHVQGANAELTLEDLDWDAIAEADYLHLGGTYMMPKLDGEPTRRVLEFAQENGVVTTLDMLAMPRDDLLETIEPCLPFIDYFMPGLEEAQMISGLDNREEITNFFLDRGVGHTVFKMGGEGSSIAWREAGKTQEIRLPAHDIQVVDTTGCGDAYCAGFIVGLSLGEDLERAGRLGTASAALVATGLGSDAGIVDLEQTKQFMDETEALPLSG